MSETAMRGEIDLQIGELRRTADEFRPNWVAGVFDRAADTLARLTAELAEAKAAHQESSRDWRDQFEAMRRARVTAEAALAKAVEAKAERMFPIMHGPNIPWSLIEPYEAQALRNHSQSLKRLAERGGLSMCEAMAIMSSATYEKRPIAKPTVEDWLDFIAARKARAAIRARANGESP